MNELYELAKRSMILGDIYIILGTVVFTILVYGKHNSKTSSKDQLGFLGVACVGYVMSLIPRIFIPEFSNRISAIMITIIWISIAVLIVLGLFQISFVMAGGLEPESGKGWSFTKFLNWGILILHILITVGIIAEIIVRIVTIYPTI